MKKLLLIATLCGIGFTAHADEGSYVGVGLGYGTQKLDHLGSGENQHTGKLGAKIYGGYQFNDNFALEGGYHYLNKTKADWSTSYDRWTKESGNFSLQGHLFSVAAVGIIPVNSQFSLFGKLGGGAYHAKAKAAWTETDFYGTESENASKTKTHGVPVFGLGGEYKFDKNMAVRVEYENFGKPKAWDTEAKLKRLDMFSISFRNAFN
jgi:OOP family OmpA-OmpF porin